MALVPRVTVVDAAVPGCVAVVVAGLRAWACVSFSSLSFASVSFCFRSSFLWRTAALTHTDRCRGCPCRGHSSGRCPCTPRQWCGARMRSNCWANWGKGIPELLRALGPRTSSCFCCPRPRALGPAPRTRGDHVGRGGGGLGAHGLAAASSQLAGRQVPWAGRNGIGLSPRGVRPSDRPSLPPAARARPRDRRDLHAGDPPPTFSAYERARVMPAAPLVNGNARRPQRRVVPVTGGLRNREIMPASHKRRSRASSSTANSVT